jgi:NADH-ubiquinone oxidoreductase chain 4
LYDRTHTKALKYLGGRATAMPLFSMMFFLFSLCNMALPLTPNFVGEFISLCGIFAKNGFSLMVCMIGVILRAVYSLWAYARVVHGMPKIQYITAMADLNRREWWTLALLAIIAVWWGLKPNAVLDSLACCVYYWQQCSLSTPMDVSWALLVSTCSKK